MSGLRSRHRPGAEQFYAAVWYSARRAEEAFLAYLEAVERGDKTDRWTYLAQHLKALDVPEPERIPFFDMREDLACFANTFGLTPDTPPTTNAPQTRGGTTTMKVNIYETVGVTDEERFLIAAFYDGEGSPRRQASRDEIKEFVWSYGRNWLEELLNFSRKWPQTDDDPANPAEAEETGNEDEDEDEESEGSVDDDLAELI